MRVLPLYILCPDAVCQGYDAILIGETLGLDVLGVDLSETGISAANEYLPHTLVSLCHISKFVADSSRSPVLRPLSIIKRAISSVPKIASEL